MTRHDLRERYFSDAIDERAASIILVHVHNRPSGNTDPSHEDIAVTERLVEAGELPGIKIHDRIIISKDCHTSYDAKQRIFKIKLILTSEIRSHLPNYRRTNHTCPYYHRTM